MASIVIRNAVLNGQHVDVSIHGNRFEAIAPHIAERGNREIDAAGRLLFPPFYNCHTHTAMTLFRGYADDLALFDWLNNHIWPAEARLTAEDIYAGTRLAGLEMIKSGTVFFNDSYFQQSEAIRAAEELGLRACIGMTWLNTGNAESCAKLTAENEKIHDAWKAGKYSGRITIALAPHAIYTVPEADLKAIAERSEREGLLVHMHLAETQTEVLDCQKAHQGRTPVQYIADCGLLTRRARLAHAVWLTPQDIKLIAQSGAVLVTNATSNLKLASGMFHFAEVDRAGIPITLGTDGVSSNNSHSMFSEMKIAAVSAKAQSMDPTAAPAARVFADATSGGAAAFVPEAGAIAPGRLADAMLINPDEPYFVGDYNWVSNLVYAGESSCVDTVICDGQVLMQHRVVPHEFEILEAARKACRKFKSEV